MTCLWRGHNAQSFSVGFTIPDLRGIGGSTLWLLLNFLSVLGVMAGCALKDLVNTPLPSWFPLLEPFGTASLPNAERLWAWCCNRHLKSSSPSPLLLVCSLWLSPLPSPVCDPNEWNDNSSGSFRLPGIGSRGKMLYNKKMNRTAVSKIILCYCH